MGYGSARLQGVWKPTNSLSMGIEVKKEILHFQALDLIRSSQTRLSQHLRLFVTTGRAYFTGRLQLMRLIDTLVKVPSFSFRTVKDAGAERFGVEWLKLKIKKSRCISLQARMSLARPNIYTI